LISVRRATIECCAMKDQWSCPIAIYSLSRWVNIRRFRRIREIMILKAGRRAFLRVFWLLFSRRREFLVKENAEFVIPRTLNATFCTTFTFWFSLVALTLGISIDQSRRGGSELTLTLRFLHAKQPVDCQGVPPILVQVRSRVESVGWVG
jgi:hypothetical protein